MENEGYMITDWLDQNGNPKIEEQTQKEALCLEFERYLQSIGGLKSAWYTDKVPIISRNICSCGDGWLPMIQNLIQELIDAGWNKEISQIKEKFGSLRFYIGGGSDEMYTIIGKYEHKSLEICEECGEPGELVISNRWWQTKCDKHKPEGSFSQKEFNKKFNIE